MRAIWARFSPVGFSGLALIEASGTQVKNRSVDVIWRLADSHDVVSLRLTTLEVKLHTNVLRSDPASGNAIAQFITFGSGGRTATITRGTTTTLLEESGHPDLLVGRLQGSVDGVPVVPGRVKLLKGAEVASGDFKNEIPR